MSTDAPTGADVASDAPDDEDAPRPRSERSKRGWLLALTLAVIVVASAPFTEALKGKMSHDADRIATDFKTARDGCHTQEAGDVDLCLAQAVVTRERAQAQSDLRFNDTPKTREDGANSVARAEYLLAREECKRVVGAAAQASCNDLARAELMRKRGDSRAERIAERAKQREAQQRNASGYWRDIAKCDSESGRVKYECQRQVTMQYHQ